MGLKGIFIAFIVAGLFAYALISASLWVSVANGGQASITDDPDIARLYTQLSGNLTDAYDSAESSDESLSSSTVTLSSDGIIFDSIAGIWKVLKNNPVAILNAILGIVYVKVFGSSEFAVVISTVSAIFIMIIIFAVWKWGRTGDAD